MKKTVTKEELGQALLKVLGQSVPYSKHEEILNELFPPEFKVGDKVMVIGKRSIEARSLNGDVVELKTVSNNTVSTYVGMHYGMHFDEVRHATPDEIAAAEWEEGKFYKVFGMNNVVNGSYIWLVEDCDGSCILSAHLTEEEAEKEREKISSGYAPSVDFRVYSVQIS